MSSHYERNNAAYRAYLDKFNAAHPNNDQYCPEVVSEWNCPSTEGAVSVGNGLKLSDGRVIKQVISGNRCFYEIYPSQEAFFNYAVPLSENQYYHC